MSKPMIYLLFSCDEWKAKPALCCAAVTSTHIRRAVERELHAKDMEYGDEGMNVTQQIKMFRADWRTLTRERINDKLRYGFLDTTYSGDTY